MTRLGQSLAVANGCRIQLPTREIQLSVKRQSRKTIAIHILSKHEVEVRAPLKCAWVEIDRFVDQKMAWIVKAAEECEPVKPPTRYLERSIHPYLGKQMRLSLNRGKPSFVGVDNDCIVMRCMKPDDESLVRKHLEAWYRREAERHLPARTACLNEAFSDGVDVPRMTVRKMKARWGSCDGRNEICINSLLMRKSPEAIDLVLTHELCHLRHFGHNKSFYRLLSSVMPDWQAREKALQA